MRISDLSSYVCSSDLGILVDLSTNSPTAIRKVAAAAADRGILVLDAPGSGGMFGAATGRLAVMVGGDKDGFERCKQVFDAKIGSAWSRGRVCQYGEILVVGGLLNKTLQTTKKD